MKTRAMRNLLTSLLILALLLVWIPNVSAITIMSPTITETAIARAQLMQQNNNENIAKFRQVPSADAQKTVAQYYNGWCARFVYQMFNFAGIDVSVGQYASTVRERYRAAGALHTDENAPRGAVVFFYYTTGGSEKGHIGISMGDGTYISALSTVKTIGLHASTSCVYAGWACWGAAPEGYRMPSEVGSQPSAPSGQVTTKLTDTSATISWNAVSGANSYEVQFWSQVMTAWKADPDYKTKTATSYTSTGLVNYDWYKYRIRAVNSAGASPWSAECTVYFRPTSVALNKNTSTLTVGGTDTLTTTVAPSSTYDKSVSWSSSNSSVATVSNGVVTAKGAGSATITATSASNPNVKATCNVTVTASTIPVTSIKLNKTSLSLNIDKNGGGSETLAVTVTPSNATDKGITWSSNKTSVATVTNGVVNAKGAGTATITATSVSNPNAKATCTVTVTAATEPVTSVKLNKTNLSLSIDSYGGGSETLTVTVSPSNAENKSVSWSSSNTSVATVSNGTVTARSAGTATITVASVSNPAVKATCAVTVSSRQVTGVTLDRSALALSVGDSYVLAETVSPSDAVDTRVTWASSNSSVATVSSTGLVQAVNAGSATITVTTNDGGYRAQCAVTVRATTPQPPSTKPPTRIYIDSQTKVFDIGEEYQLTYSLAPSDATTTVTWKSNKPSVASISQSGELTPIKEGKATITVTTANKKKATLKITIVDPKKPKGIRIDEAKKTLILQVNTPYVLRYILNPSTAESIVTWKSSKPKIASVDRSTGVVTPHRPGKAVITVTTANKKKATIRVTVQKP